MEGSERHTDLSAEPPLTETHVRAAFSHWEAGEPAAFAEHVADDVDWTQVGTHPLAKRYTSKHAYFQAEDGPIQRISRALRGPLRLHVQNVMVSGAWATVELHATGTARAGWQFDNQYCWLLEFRRGRIQTARSYIADASLVSRLIGESEG